MTASIRPARVTRIAACVLLVLSAVAAASDAGSTNLSADDLFAAIRNGNVDTVRSYVTSGKSITVRSKEGHSPLSLLFGIRPYGGSKAAQEEILRLLLDAGASANEYVPAEINPFKTPIFLWAVHSNNIHIVNELLRRGVEKEKRVRGLFGAVVFDSLEMTKAIIGTGIDVNSRDRFGQTPLFLVDSVRMAEYLVSIGADVNAKTYEGESVMGWLSDPMNETGTDVMTYLASKGAR
jgi:ankyrin repeat protein